MHIVTYSAAHRHSMSPAGAVVATRSACWRTFRHMRHMPRTVASHAGASGCWAASCTYPSPAGPCSKAARQQQCALVNAGQLITRLKAAGQNTAAAWAWELPHLSPPPPPPDRRPVHKTVPCSWPLLTVIPQPPDGVKAGSRWLCSAAEQRSSKAERSSPASTLPNSP